MISSYSNLIADAYEYVRRTGTASKTYRQSQTVRGEERRNAAPKMGDQECFRRFCGCSSIA